ncbi:Abhydro lipase and Abhydrolase 1 domain containin g protein [Trichuris trichiura]|uniref:Abhydro lipase and Abhydrolase 1 domain containin g protein n=1 Tax=Trichuris trichiura TaxID=36087 RepID=A0A077YX78_TRITR|nr:Abhydro lipase and Abhydrolase 1 domain containin g protein [Trichuris trichiura]
MADAGYDVWLGNIRGNIYSKGHLFFSSRSKEYWSFTFDQMAEYDLPAMVEYVLHVTNHSSLDYVGHSQVAYVGHTRTILRRLRPFFRLVNWMLKHSHNEILANTEGVKWVARKICKRKTVRICEMLLHCLGGYEPRNVNASRLSVYLSHYPAGTSTLNIAHFGQLITSNRMQKFDYGPEGNLIHYNQEDPPQYHPERSRVPTALYWGTNDVLSVERDVARLITITRNELGLYRYTNTEHCGIILLHGYACQEHSVVTKDGYILKMQRISGKSGRTREKGKTGQPVFLQHGLFRSSIDWLINRPDQSLAFLLAQAGYDVWLGNVRGNTYSKQHISLNPTMKRFWRFTFDQMAIYDLPAMVDYVLDFTNHSSLHYVGYSQGNLIGFACFSEAPEWAKDKIRSFHAFAPIAFLGNVKSAFASIRPFFRLLNWMLEQFGKEFLPKRQFVRWLGAKICSGRAALLCKKVLLLIGDYHPKSINATRMPVYLAHSSDGTSTMNVAHFGQVPNKHALVGILQAEPPLYHPERNPVPTALYCGSDDLMSDELDVKRLSEQTQNLIGLYEYEGIHHLDFTWGLNVVNTVYAQFMQVLSAQCT